LEPPGRAAELPGSRGPHPRRRRGGGEREPRQERGAPAGGCRRARAGEPAAEPRAQAARVTGPDSGGGGARQRAPPRPFPGPPGRGDTMASTGLVTVGGLATGLDTNQIISQLVAAASAPVTLLQNQLAAVQVTQSSIGTLAGDLSALGTAARTLSTSSDESVVTAAAGAGAQNGAVTLNVIQLAHGSTATSSIGLAASSDTVATG